MMAMISWVSNNAFADTVAVLAEGRYSPFRPLGQFLVAITLLSRTVALYLGGEWILWIVCIHQFIDAVKQCIVVEYWLQVLVICP